MCTQKLVGLFLATRCLVIATANLHGYDSSSQRNPGNLTDVDEDFNKQIHLAGEHFKLRIHQNTTSSYFADVLVSIRDLQHHKSASEKASSSDVVF